MSTPHTQPTTESPLPKAWEDRFSFDAPVTGLAFLDATHEGGIAVAAAGDGSLVFAENGAWQRVTAHETGATLCLAKGGDGESVLSGGDDGRLVRIAMDGTVAELARHKGKWVEHVAGHEATGLTAYAVGKDVHILNSSRQPNGPPLAHPATVGGLAISPNGKRLAVCHYGGISLWWLNGKEQIPVVYKWSGSHLGVWWHPDGGHVLTTMQDAALHGWRLSDGMEMRMQGYKAKVISWGWTPRGKLLVTSGAEQAVGWPFTGGGPWGKAPKMLGDPLGVLVTAVAAHPTDDLVALGYENGAVVFAALAESAPPLPILSPTGARITALGWSGDGKRLVSGDESGQIYSFTLASVGAAFQR